MNIHVCVCLCVCVYIYMYDMSVKDPEGPTAERLSGAAGRGERSGPLQPACGVAGAASRFLAGGACLQAANRPGRGGSALEAQMPRSCICMSAGLGRLTLPTPVGGRTRAPPSQPRRRAHPFLVVPVTLAGYTIVHILLRLLQRSEKQGAGQ